jgi:hypothetical protein
MSSTVKKYEILDWVDIEKINWKYLSTNPNAIESLNEYYDEDAIYNFAQEYCMGYFNTYL